MFDAVRAAAPRRLFIAADGPRPDQPDDPDRCERTRQVFSGIDWPCEVRTQFQDGNLGCKRGVGTAIDWFLSERWTRHHRRGRLRADHGLFPVCAELLDRYRDAAEVMMIGGHNLLGAWDGGKAGYLFSRTSSIWRWATWRRAWAHYDETMARWADPRRAGRSGRGCLGPSFGSPASGSISYTSSAGPLGLRMGVRHADRRRRVGDARM
jgi:hypothetical protein